MRVRTLAAVPALALLLTSLPAVGAPTAKEKAEARSLVAEGDKAMKDKRWTEAISAYRKANKVDPSPAVDVALGGALAAAGKLVEARKVLTAAESEAQGALKKAAKKALSEVSARVATVKVKVSGPPEGKAQTLIDGIEVDGSGEISLNPGDHTVGATADGFEPVEKEVKLSDGAHEEVALTLAAKAAASDAAAASGAAPAPAPEAEKKHGSRVPGAMVLGLGAAGLLSATIFGAIAIKYGGDARGQCNGDLCPSSAADDIARARTFGNASTAAFVASGAIAVTGVVLTVVAPSDEPKAARLSPFVGPGLAGVSLRARF